ncbi:MULTISPECIES: Hsp20/alpha crystallin family protein [unclassified Parafrankia]|uniref:Hsp20/alpha crystallin family protein n=1 Tax=unclassified Parafrankia TaxID=2994368 RepID=UPI000DD3D115|nr:MULTISPECIES: Hsp20/alpha crystallin family protein [unclassified Parafrankia]TCJ32243.1 Hsp20/alpha crystallin family protein [Parafrankia sp. BMG5.11]
MNLPTRAGTDRPVPTTRWDPFREIEDAWTRMGSLLGDVVGGEHRPYGVLAAMVPAVDVEETDDAFLVELELPGVDPKDVSIDLKENELFVTGEIKERERRGKLRRQTRRLGHFEHQITLPGDVDPESVTASLDNGVLTVRLAKARSSQPRHIEISGPTATQSGRTIDDTSGQYTDATTRSSEAESSSSEAGASSAQTSGAGSSNG